MSKTPFLGANISAEGVRPAGSHIVVLMKFSGPKSKFALTILSGPDHEGWCRLSVNLETGDGTWNSPAAPCVTDTELRELEGFFNLVDSPIRDREIDFLEPELPLKWKENELDITLSYALCPTWAEPDDGYVVSIPADESAMERARKYIADYRHNN